MLEIILRSTTKEVCQIERKCTPFPREDTLLLSYLHFLSTGDRRMDPRICFPLLLANRALAMFRVESPHPAAAGMRFWAPRCKLRICGKGWHLELWPLPVFLPERQKWSCKQPSSWDEEATYMRMTASTLRAAEQNYRNGLGPGAAPNSGASSGLPTSVLAVMWEI